MIDIIADFIIFMFTAAWSFVAGLVAVIVIISVAGTLAIGAAVIYDAAKSWIKGFFNG